MKVRVINLKHREDRRKWFEETNGPFLEGHDWSFVEAVDGSKLSYGSLVEAGFDTDKNWRDPLLKRPLTRGEIGCFLSHWRMWEEIADGNEPVLVMEDDCYLSEKLSKDWVQGDITYLAHKEMLSEGVRENRVCYPYWAAAMIYTPHAAETLLETDVDRNIIPVDEFLPRMTDRLKMVSLDKAKQKRREELGSDVEPKQHSDFFFDFTVHCLTCHDDDKKAERLMKSNPYIVNILDEEWRGGTMEGPGGGQKLNCLKHHLESLPDHDVVVFSDGFDVFWSSPVDEVVGRYLGMKAEVVFASEKYLWPNKHLRFPPCHTDYRYLNSGCFVGRVGELKRILQTPILDSADDQLYLQHQFLSGRFDIKLDYEQYIFQTNSEAVKVIRGMIYNSDTRCYGCIYHGNGGNDAKKRFECLYDQLYPELKYANLEVSDYKVIGNEMLLVDFLSPSQCEEWIRIGEEHGEWNPHPADKFPSHDIHLKLLGLYEEVDTWWSKIASRVFEKYWTPTKNYHLRKAFLMKYSADTQKSLGHHNDASMVTGSVKLNDDYEGATLVFPRQKVTNQDIPIGKMILFPGQVTHGHYVDPLISGTKYSATFWSARYKGDLLDPE